MDFYNESKKLLGDFGDDFLETEFGFAIQHIRIAQIHFENAIKDDFEAFYSDVIYRSLKMLLKMISKPSILM